MHGGEGAPLSVQYAPREMQPWMAGWALCPLSFTLSLALFARPGGPRACTVVRPAQGRQAQRRQSGVGFRQSSANMYVCACVSSTCALLLLLLLPL